MAVTYGLTIENENLIIDKAENKRDGVFQFRGVTYRVRDGRVTHFCYGGKVLERAYGFNCVVGEYEAYYGSSDNPKSILANIKN